MERSRLPRDWKNDVDFARPAVLLEFNRRYSEFSSWDRISGSEQLNLALTPGMRIFLNKERISDNFESVIYAV